VELPYGDEHDLAELAEALENSAATIDLHCSDSGAISSAG
jgi:hypothetical protein